MKQILITGLNSYIGNKFEEWIKQWPNQYNVSKISLRNDDWRDMDWSEIDVIIHVAGIAHIKETEENKQLYYQINRDLSSSVAAKAKKEGIKHFIFLSTMSVYGIDNGIIEKNTKEKPTSAYGKSKYEAENVLSELETSDFRIGIVRPPMVYGPKSPGNYQKLSKVSRYIPVFPNIRNKRSMIYIDNLSEFLKIIIDSNMKGIFLPQNEKYVNTSDMVKLIASIHGKSIHLTKILNPILKRVKTKVVSKVFGDLVYDDTISSHELNYNVYGFEESIQKSER